MQAKVGDDEALVGIAEAFGRIQRHILSDHRGIVDISVDTQENPKIGDANEYGGLSAKSFALHTDGAFLQGIAQLDETIAFELRPPRLIVMACKIQASEGGGNILVDGHDLYDRLLADFPDLIDALTVSGSAAFVRDQEQSGRSQVFERCSDGTLQIRYRGDRQMFLAERLGISSAELRSYVKEKVSGVLVELHEGDIVIVDNTRIVHSREDVTAKSLSESRSMRRLWVFDERSERFGDGDIIAGRRSMETLAGYVPMPRSSQDPALDLALGIRR